ncbi:uncharacterized protein LOC142326155 [Lycorma delicatula]|uniref:uncharacterized protein LOC142326155 n=1 Tax=Lycorma delicatula TaxID=130591 RepID=UPI003F50F323
MVDAEAQELEIGALQSIYNDDEFNSYNNSDGLLCAHFYAFLKLPESFSIVFCDDSSHSDADCWADSKHNFISVEHLPPVEMLAVLPYDYPSKSAPQFHLSCSWLSGDMLAKLCNKLDEIWKEKTSPEILYIWIEFLKEETLNFLKIKNKLRINICNLKSDNSKQSQSIIKQTNEVVLNNNSNNTIKESENIIDKMTSTTNSANNNINEIANADEASSVVKCDEKEFSSVDKEDILKNDNIDVATVSESKQISCDVDGDNRNNTCTNNYTNNNCNGNNYGNNSVKTNYKTFQSRLFYNRDYGGGKRSNQRNNHFFDNYNYNYKRQKGRYRRGSYNNMNQRKHTNYAKACETNGHCSEADNKTVNDIQKKISDCDNVNNITRLGNSVESTLVLHDDINFSERKSGNSQSSSSKHCDINKLKTYDNNDLSVASSSSLLSGVTEDVIPVKTGVVKETEILISHNIGCYNESNSLVSDDNINLIVKEKENVYDGGEGNCSRNSYNSVTNTKENVDFRDKRVKTCLSQYYFNNLKNYLKNYNEDRILTEFNKSYFCCIICYQDKMGHHCMQFKPCDHTFCKDCIRQYVQHKITDGSVYVIKCPQDECESEIMPSQVRDLVSPEQFARYDNLLLTTTLQTMTDITVCPRQSCQYPVSREPDEKMAVCPECRYVFCVNCKMVYHGVEPCRFRSDEKAALVKQYLEGNEETKQTMEHKYGRKQLNALVQASLSETWISNNSQNCPHCNASIEKSGGCNKMVCWRCSTFFCWLCQARLDPATPYKHYNDPKSCCFNQLFEGANISDDEDDDVDEFIVVEDFVDDDGDEFAVRFE